MTKKGLRKEYLSKRMLLDEAEQQKRIKEIGIHFKKICLSKAAFAMSYMAMAAKKEISPVLIEKAVVHQYPECRLCYPKIGLADGRMEAIEHAVGMDMSINIWGIKEPESNRVVDPQQIDVIIVPLLIFDKRGYRVGYGKGFYDRFIARCRPDVITIGLSFFEPVEKIEDLNEFDIPLGFCITPERLYSF